MLLNKVRLTSKNIIDYIGNSYHVVGAKHIAGIPALLQKDYGEDNDCSLVCVTTVIAKKLGIKATEKVKLNEIYNAVFEIARKLLFNSKHGFFMLFNRLLLKRAAEIFDIKSTATIRLVKSVGFNFNSIKKLLDQDMPIILTITNDNREFYKHHSVTVIGYKEYRNAVNSKEFLMVYDNWSKEISFVDYQKLCSVCSITYFE